MSYLNRLYIIVKLEILCCFKKLEVKVEWMFLILRCPVGVDDGSFDVNLCALVQVFGANSYVWLLAFETESKLIASILRRIKNRTINYIKLQEYWSVSHKDLHLIFIKNESN